MTAPNFTKPAELTRAYTHPQITRDAFLAELRWHQDHDRIVSGTYGDGTPDANFKACAVGCSLHSVKKLLHVKGKFDYGDHAQYPVYLGIPQILAKTQDRVFEGLRGTKQTEFPLRFSAAIQTGADLSGVWPKFMARVLREIALPAVSEKHSKSRVAVARVAAGLETGWLNDSPQEARSAAYAAADAAYAAAYADDAAYAAADAASAAASAASAADAAAAADAASAASAASAADAAARTSAYEKMAHILCDEMAAAPVEAAV